MSRTELNTRDRLRLVLMRSLTSFTRRRSARRTVESAICGLVHRAGLDRSKVVWLDSPSQMWKYLDGTDPERTATAMSRITALRTDILSRQRVRAAEVGAALLESPHVLRCRPETLELLKRFGGNSDLSWTFASDYIERHLQPCLLFRQRLNLAAFRTAARGTLCWLHTHDETVIVDRPRHRVRVPRWLRDDLPDARRLVFADGTDTVVWRDRMVDANAILNPRLEDIVAEPNVFVRQLLLETYGVEAFFRDANAALIHSDLCGRLYRIEAAHPVQLVRVINSTPEHDGHFKEYILCVPPWVRSARAAVAWTFGFSEDGYRPEVET